MRKKINAKVGGNQKRRAATYITQDLWNEIVTEAARKMTTESHIIRLLIVEALEARSKK
jgi:hypothetical protein